MKYFNQFALVVSCALLINLNSLPAADKSALPNIVIILIDDMGYGDVGCYNPKSKIKTTNMDALASAGMRFTDAHAPGPLCHMSRYGLMTGTYPFHIYVNLWPKEPLITPGQMTIVSVAKAAGYQMAMVGKWHKVALRAM